MFGSREATYNKQAARKQMLNECFSRYHANAQKRYDWWSTFGALMYLTMLPALWKVEQGRTACIAIIFLSILTTWPALLSSWRPHVYSKYRNVLFALHFFLHHALVPPFLSRIGVSFQGKFVYENPFLFFTSFLFTSTICWHCVNPLMYRIKFRDYCIVQPLVILASLRHEWAHCSWAVSLPGTAAGTAFKTATDLGDLLLSGFFPISSNILSSGDISKADVYHECLQAHTWLLFTVAFIIPAYFIYKLEAQMWITFLLTRPENLPWPGGPSATEIAALQSMACREIVERGRPDTLIDRRAIALMIIASLSVWVLLRIII